MIIKELKTLHPVIYARALERQEECGNKPNENRNLYDSPIDGGFLWSNTKEGDEVWDEVNLGNFEFFYKLIPEEDRPEYWNKKEIN